MQQPGKLVLAAMLDAMVAIGPADWPRFQLALRAGQEQGATRAQFEELLLQATLFYGFPRVVTAFEQLTQAWPRDEQADPRGKPIPAAEWAARGRELFAGIYANNDGKVRAMLQGFHPEFHDFVLEAAYGRILARPELSPMIRELLAVAALATLDQTPQLIAHARGAQRFGADQGMLADSLEAAGCDQQLRESLLRKARI